MGIRSNGNSISISVSIFISLLEYVVSIDLRIVTSFPFWWSNVTSIRCVSYAFHEVQRWYFSGVTRVRGIFFRILCLYRKLFLLVDFDWVGHEIKSVRFETRRRNVSIDAVCLYLLDRWQLLFSYGRVKFSYTAGKQAVRTSMATAGARTFAFIPWHAHSSPFKFHTVFIFSRVYASLIRFVFISCFYYVQSYFIVIRFLLFICSNCLSYSVTVQFTLANQNCFNTLYFYFYFIIGSIVRSA